MNPNWLKWVKCTKIGQMDPNGPKWTKLDQDIPNKKNRHVNINCKLANKNEDKKTTQINQLMPNACKALMAIQSIEVKLTHPKGIDQSEII